MSKDPHLLAMQWLFSYWMIWFPVFLTVPPKYMNIVGRIGVIGFIPLALNVIWGWF